MKYSRVYDKVPSKMLKSIFLLFVLKSGYLICIKLKCFRDSNMANFMLL